MPVRWLKLVPKWQHPRNSALGLFAEEIPPSTTSLKNLENGLFYTVTTSRFWIFRPADSPRFQSCTLCARRYPCLEIDNFFDDRMKLRPVSTTTLRRHLQIVSPRTSASNNGARGVCTRCKQQYVVGAGRPTAIVRARLSPGTPGIATRRNTVLPAVFIAGQRRSLATVQNGTISGTMP